MKVQVCVPWRPGDAGRADAWSVVSAFWQDAGLPPVTADSDPDLPFNRGQARNRAAQGEWDVAIFADACILPQLANVRVAIIGAAKGQLVHAHTRVVRLSERGTRDLLRGAPPQRLHIARTTGPRTPGGVFAIGRALYEKVGGWDEGFEGWGGEDSAFVMRAGRFGRRSNVGGDCWHLWHEHSDRNLHSAAFRRNRSRVRHVVWA